jgi:hypothetical protein
MSAYIVVSAKVMESSMHRRNILVATLASAGALFSAARAHAAAPDTTKVVYHLDDIDKVDFVLGNIAKDDECASAPRYDPLRGLAGLPLLT